MNSKLRVLVLLAFGLVAGGAVLRMLQTDAGLPRQTEVDFEQTVLQKLKGSEPGSIEAGRLQKVLDKIRRQKVGQSPDKSPTNPDILARAFDEIKLGYGASFEPYEPGYTFKEYERARSAVGRDALGKSAASQELPWVERGPINVSGRTRAIIVDPDDASGNTFFVGTIGGGVWKSIDAGATWRSLTEDLPNLSVSALKMAPSNHDVIYMGTGEGFLNSRMIDGNGLWKSMDRGESWQPMSSVDIDVGPYQNINRILVDPQDENIVLIATNNGGKLLNTAGFFGKSGIHRSVDGGQTWSRVFDPDARFALASFSPKTVQQIIANPLNFNTQYASINENGIAKSLDGGLTWAVVIDSVALPQDVGFGTRLELAIAPADTNRVYAAVERPTGVSDLLMTRDGGQSWVIVNDTGIDYNWYSGLSQFGPTTGGQGWYDNTIVVSPFDEDVVHVAGVDIYTLTVRDNNTRTSVPTTIWTPGFFPNRPVVHADHHRLQVFPIDENSGIYRIVNTNDGGMAFSDDAGATWTNIVGFNSTQYYGADKKPGANEFIGGMQDNGSYFSSPGVDANASTPWTLALFGDGFEAVWKPDDPLQMVVSSQFNGLQRTEDGGQTWASAVNGLPSGGGVAPFWSKVANSKQDPDLLFAIAAPGVYRSDNFARDWVLTPIPSNWIGNRVFSNVEISLSNPQVVWISSIITNPFNGAKIGGVHVSTDGGFTFNEVTVPRANPAPGLIALTEPSGLATHPSEDSTAFLMFSAAKSLKVMRTRDLGQTWEELSGFGLNSVSSNGFPDVGVYALLVMPHDPNIIWVGTEIGLFESTDGGQSWHIADNGLPAVMIAELSVVDDHVVAATHGRGVWSVPLPELAGYQPPVVTLAPRLDPLTQDFTQSGIVRADISLRSAYDSTVVIQNGAPFLTLPANATPLDTTLFYLPNGTSVVNFSLRAYKDGKQFRSAARNISVAPFAEPTAALVVDFNDLNFNTFISNGFTISTPNGFNDAALHSQHPYPNGAFLNWTMTVPIMVSSGEISYDEIALIEPGLAGVTDYRNPNFFDFVIVEGSKDGLTWHDIVPGYDARDDAAWLSAFNTGGSGTSTLFRTRNVTLPDSVFAMGDTLFIRFRLISDPAVVGWGWAIDNIRIQSPPTSVDDGELTGPRTFALSQNYPNPFNPTTSINYTLPQAGPVSLVIYNQIGQLVRRLVDEPVREAGEFTVKWDGKDDTGRQVATGLYFYRLRAGEFIQTRKMALLK